MPIPSIGMGTYRIGGYGSVGATRDKKAIEALQRGIELGMRLIDTAEVYRAGYSELVVGEAIKDFPREEVFIISKVLDKHLRYNEVIKACQDSIGRLQTDYIDLYLIHFPNYKVPLKETMAAMEELVQQEMVKFIGVSNFPLNLMKEAQSYLTKAEIQANEVKYNLKCRYIESDLLPYCQKEGITVIAYTPLEEGSLARNELLQEVGQEYGKTAAQIALNWLIGKESVIAIPKAANLQHLEENAGAMGWRMLKQDLERLSSTFD